MSGGGGSEMAKDTKQKNEKQQEDPNPDTANTPQTHAPQTAVASYVDQEGATQEPSTSRRDMHTQVAAEDRKIAGAQAPPRGQNKSKTNEPCGPEQTEPPDALLKTPRRYSPPPSSSRDRFATPFVQFPGLPPSDPALSVLRWQRVNSLQGCASRAMDSSIYVTPYLLVLPPLQLPGLQPERKPPSTHPTPPPSVPSNPAPREAYSRIKPPRPDGVQAEPPSPPSRIQ